ncbi:MULTISPECIES: hypothetical protein [Heyndrickxia]|uniref:hypothetical protein n=1 Tax=Heyndrickxia TaxID=2837504 RepID=UPI000B170830|nr:hypothetical protein [Heyndrickxia shackletonii]NEY99277.1 hypothetical protein [Heyndrickxia shackletonii]
MFKYFINGLICLLLGSQLYYLAKGLSVTVLPAQLLIIFGVLLMIGSFIYSARQSSKEKDSAN